MLEIELYCERCKKFLGTVFNPVHLRGWYCNKCIEKMEKERDQFWENQKKYYDDDDFWKLE